MKNELKGIAEMILTERRYRLIAPHFKKILLGTLLNVLLVFGLAIFHSHARVSSLKDTKPLNGKDMAVWDQEFHDRKARFRQTTDGFCEIFDAPKSFKFFNYKPGSPWGKDERVNGVYRVGINDRPAQIFIVDRPSHTGAAHFLHGDRVLFLRELRRIYGDEVGVWILNLKANKLGEVYNKFEEFDLWAENEKVVREWQQAIEKSRKSCGFLYKSDPKYSGGEAIVRISASHGDKWYIKHLSDNIDRQDPNRLGQLFNGLYMPGDQSITKQDAEMAKIQLERAEECRRKARPNELRYADFKVNGNGVNTGHLERLLMANRIYSRMQYEYGSSPRKNLYTGAAHTINNVVENAFPVLFAKEPSKALIDKEIERARYWYRKWENNDCTEE